MANERKIWITLGKGGDIEGTPVPCVIRAYSTKEAAAVAVANSLSAKHKLESKLQPMNRVERREFLSSTEAAYLNRKITGEEWFEEITLVD